MAFDFDDELDDSFEDSHSDPEVTRDERPENEAASDGVPQQHQHQAGEQEGSASFADEPLDADAVVGVEDVRIFDSASDEAFKAFTGDIAPTFTAPDASEVVGGREVPDAPAISAEHRFNNETSTEPDPEPVLPPEPEPAVEPAPEPTAAAARFEPVPEPVAEPEPVGSNSRPHRLRPLATLAGAVVATVLVGGIAVGGSYLGFKHFIDDDAAEPSTAVAQDRDEEESSGSQESRQDSSRPAVNAESKKTPQQVLSETVAAECEEGKRGKTTITRADGSADTPEGALKGFQYAYYSERDAIKATSYLDKGVYSSVDEFQDAIDSSPQGTQYCLEYFPDQRRDTFNVKVTVFQPPSGTESEPETDTIKQKMTLSQEDNKWVISKIRRG